MSAAIDLDQQRRQEVSDFARVARLAGFSVVPPCEDGTKKPIKTWKQYQRTHASDEEFAHWYDGATRQGVGVITGEISGGLECLDFDDRDAWGEYLELAKQAGLGELLGRVAAGYREETPNGMHLFWRCESIGGNQKIAWCPDKRKARIETRGEGGFVVVAPSHGRVHADGDYSPAEGGPATIETVTADERDDLLNLARAMDEAGAAKAAAEYRRTEAPLASTDGVRPGDDYARHTPWSDILEPHGWRQLFTTGDGTTHWCRPGKRSGTSATTGHAGTDFLYVFSTSTEFESGRGYGKFSAFALLEHGADFKAAARALREGGFGESRARAKVSSGGSQHQSGQLAPPAPALSQTGGTFADLGFSLRDQVPAAKYLLRRDGGGSLERGKCAMMAAEGGAGKTATLMQLAMAVSAGHPWLEVYQSAAPERVLAFFAEEDMRRIRERAGCIADLLRFSDESRAHCERNVFFWSGADRSCAMFVAEGRVVEPTDLFWQFRELALEQRPALIVLDPLAAFAPCAETDHESASFVMDALKTLAAEADSALYIAHHTRKPNATRDPSQHDARGSSAITNVVREQHALEKDRDGTGAVFEVTKANNGVWGPRSRIPLIFDEVFGYMTRPRHPSEMAHQADEADARAQRRAERKAAEEAERASKWERVAASVLGYLTATPGAGKRAVRAGASGSNADIDAVVDWLEAEGQIARVQGARNRVHFYVAGTEPEAAE